MAAREGKVCAACLEISIIVNDWRAKIVGGMETALLLWEACCIPPLLHGAGSWVEMSPSTEKKLVLAFDPPGRTWDTPCFSAI